MLEELAPHLPDGTEYSAANQSQLGTAPKSFISGKAQNIFGFMEEDVRLKILVVDEDDISFLIIKYYFDQAGLQPEWVRARSVAEATGYLQQNPALNLALLEPMLECTGYDYNTVLRALDDTGIFTQTKVCLLTTFLLGELDELGKEYTVFKRFVKPFRKSYIESILQVDGK